jgi:hypothetical protein
MRTVIPLVFFVLLAGCDQQGGVDYNAELSDHQEDLRFTLGEVTKTLQSLAAQKSGNVAVEKVELENGTVVFAFWPSGEYQVWGVEKEGRIVTLAFREGEESQRIDSTGLSWILKR